VRGDKQRARELRRNQTDAEVRLWLHLRDRRLAGVKFRRQFQIGPYFADFACPERRLIVELDGGQHAERERYDNNQTAYMRRTGWCVVLYWNDDVLLRIEHVVNALIAALARAPHPNPLPARGERERST
jgi:very-short-patch-repair endonuclease